MLKFGGPLRTYPTQAASSGLAAAQQQLDRCFTGLLVALEQGFAGDKELDLTSMWALPGRIVAVWAAGGVPTFEPVKSGAPG